MKLSFIVPVYNVEAYLSKCIDSLLSQGLDEQEYEIVLVNDGSTDSSPAICHSYARRYPNIRVVSQENKGLAGARNTGLDNVQSDYVCFLDSDDYLLENGISSVLKGLDGNTDWDILMYGSWYDSREIPQRLDTSVFFRGNAHQFILQHYLPSFCWNFIYKRDFIERHRLRFKYYGCEDTLWTGHVFMLNPRMVASNAPIHRYLVREDSISTDRSKAKARKLVPDYSSMTADIFRLFAQYAAYDKALYDKCVAIQNSKKVYGITRILTADYNRGEYQDVMRKAKADHLCPVKASSPSLKDRVKTAALNLTVLNYPLYKLSALLFNKLFTPYVLPRIRKNL